MEDIVILVAFIGIGISLFFLIRRVDYFIGIDQKKTDTIKRPSCIILTGEMSDKEILEEVHRFKESCDSIRICLYDSSNDSSYRN